jgi:hypothetical protein
MKNVKLSILGLSLVLLVASCKKEDFKEETLADAPASTIGLDEADSVGWNASGTWETADQETFSVRYFSIEDVNITEDVADNGLVLLFKKNGNSVNAMPFEEEGAAASEEGISKANYWYHQVAEGGLLISCDVYESAKAPGAENSFKYFIITPEKLKTLEADGHTTEALMGLSYKEAVALLGNSGK